MPFPELSSYDRYTYHENVHKMPCQRTRREFSIGDRVPRQRLEAWIRVDRKPECFRSWSGASVGGAQAAEVAGSALQLECPTPARSCYKVKTGPKRSVWKL